MDSAYQVHMLAAGRDLPERLAELLDGMEAGAELLFYFCGYLAWLGAHAPALVMNAERLRAFSLRKLASLIEQHSECSLLILDVVYVANEGRRAAETADAVCDVLDDYPLIEGLVAVRESAAAPAPYSSPFTLLVLRSYEWLAAVRDGVAITAADLNQLLQLGREWLGGIDATRYSTAESKPVLFPGALDSKSPRRGASDPSNIAEDAPQPVESSDAVTDASPQPVESSNAATDASPTAQRSTVDPASLTEESSGASAPSQVNDGSPGAAPAEADELASAEAAPQAQAGAVAMPVIEVSADSRVDTPSLVEPSSAGIEGASRSVADVDADPTRLASDEPTMVAAVDVEALDRAAAAFEADSLAIAASETVAEPSAEGAPASTAVASGGNAAEAPAEEDEADVPDPVPDLAELDADQCLERAQQLIAEGRLAAALTVFERATELIDDIQRRQTVHELAANAARNLGDGARALSHYRKILEADPLESSALFWATEILCESGDWDGVDELQSARLQALDTDEQRAELLATQVGLWLDTAQDMDRGRRALEALARYRPDDIDVLDRLIPTLEATQDFEEAIRVRRKLAFKLSEQPARRSELLLGAARIARERLGKVEFAVDLAEQALRADPGDIGALDFVAAVLVGREEWPLLAKSYEAVLEKLQDGPVALDLASKTALVCSEKLKDPRRASRALERAVGIEPRDPRLRAELCDLLILSQQHEVAAGHCQVLLRQQPRVEAHYRRAYAIYSALGRHDQAWSAAHALDYLGYADINESLHSDLHRPDGLLPVIQGLSDDEWCSGALDPDRDSEIQALLDVVAEPAIELQAAALSKAKQLLEPDPKLRVDPKVNTTTLARTFLWTARLLGMPPPALYVCPDVADGLSSGPAREPVSLASRALGGGIGLPELAFLCGRHLAGLRPEYRLALFFPTVEQLTTLVTAAFAAWDWSPRKAKIYSPEIKKLAQGLYDRLDEAGRDALRTATAGLSLGQAESRLLAWMRSVELVAARAGLLACGDLHVACDLVERYPLGTYTSPFDQITALLPFKLSDEYVKLRGHLGVQVTG